MAAAGTIHFIHGKESGPNGNKILALAQVASQAGFKTRNLDYSVSQDPGVRLQMLLDACAGLTTPPVLVGSSMGGWMAAEAAARIPVRGLFLLAPALYMPGYPTQEPDTAAPTLEIVHGWRDDIIPPENSIRFARQKRATLHLVDSDHRLNDQIPLLQRMFGMFLDRVRLDAAAGKRR